MNTPNDWVNNYLTPEEQQKMAELSRQSYSSAAAQKIAQWGQNWTEEDQQRVSQQWNAVFAELKRLAVEGKDPASPEVQALARQHQELVQQFTRGDAEVEAGLNQWWQNYSQLPENEKPIPQYSTSPEEAAFLNQALKHYHQG